MKRFLNTAFLLFTLCFLARLGYIALNTRLVGDDYCFLAAVREHGFWGGQWQWYQTWQGRWFSTFITMAMTGLFSGTGNLAVYAMLLLAVTIAGIYFLLAKTSERMRLIDLSRTALLGGAAVLAYLFHSCILNPAESFHWLCASANFVLPIALACFLIPLIASGASPVRSFLLALAIAGCSETAAAIEISLLAFYFAYRALRERSWPWHVVFPFAGAAISLVIELFSPGNRMRQAQFDHYEGFLPSSIIMAAGYAIEVLGRTIQSKKAWMLASVFFGVVWSATFGAVGRSPIGGAAFVKSVLSASAIALGICALCLLPSVHMAGGNASDRIWVIITGVVIGYCFYLGCAIGRTALAARAPLSALQAILAVLLLCCSGYQISLLIRLVPELSAYSISFSERHAYLTRLRQEGGKGPAVFPPLAHTWVYPKTVLSAEGGGWVNECVQKGMGLPFQVQQKQ